MEGGSHRDDWRIGQHEDERWRWYSGAACTSIDPKGWRSPCGVAGDVLWVREAFTAWAERYDPGETYPDSDDEDNPWDEPDHYGDPVSAKLVRFRATPRVGMRKWDVSDEIQRMTYLHHSTEIERAPGPRKDNGETKWAPSIFMPRWACRLRLKVLEVRIERLQQITAGAALAEGVDVSDCTADRGKHALERFEKLWDGINGKRGPWASNCWVWVVRFEVAS